MSREDRHSVVAVSGSTGVGQKIYLQYINYIESFYLTIIGCHFLSVHSAERPQARRSRGRK